MHGACNANKKVKAKMTTTAASAAAVTAAIQTLYIISVKVAESFNIASRLLKNNSLNLFLIEFIIFLCSSYKHDHL